LASAQYGRVELKKAFHRNYFRGLLISVIIHAFIVGSYYAGELLGSDDDDIPMVRVRILKYSDLGPPPSISAVPPPPTVGVAAAVKPWIGGSCRGNAICVYAGSDEQRSGQGVGCDSVQVHAQSGELTAS
ncbi:MAG: hypothetical protein HY961_17275, partial [Ignavibacteriae bacterium]|nr:hypothetical protein [Ignavibacteriota bacterium]